MPLEGVPTLGLLPSGYRSEPRPHERPHQWVHEWTHECVHESAHKSSHDAPTRVDFPCFPFKNSPRKLPRNIPRRRPRKCLRKCPLKCLRFTCPVFHRVLHGAPPKGRQLYFTFPSAPEPFFKAPEAPFLTLRLATPSGAGQDESSREAM